MKKHYNTPEDWEAAREKVLGLGEASIRKSYYPELQERLAERQRAEEALRASEGLLRSVLDSLPIGVWIMDRNGKLALANPEAVKIWKGARFVEPERFGEYKGWRLDTGKRIEAEDWAAAKAIHKGETTLNEEVEIECFDGVTHKIILNSALPIKDENGIITGAIVVNQDITERKELERARADFVSMLTHDLKSPLTTIMGYSELLGILCKHGGEDERVEMVESIQRSSEKMLDMVNDFLLVSRLEAERMELHLVPEDLASLLDRIAKDFVPAAEMKGVRLETDLSGLPPACVDREYIERSVGNLLENAITHTPAGGRIILRAESGTRGDGRRKGQYLAVTVEDTGTGIPEEYRDRIFDRYFTAAKAGGAKGTGLGLAIVKAVAEAHGGRAAVESEPGRGSAFHIYMPLRTSCG